MRSFIRLGALVLLVSACGSTIVPPSDAGASGKGAGGKGATGGAHATGGVNGHAGAGGKTPREPEKHRPTDVACGERPAGAVVDAGAPPGLDTCMVDSDCKAGLNGRCIPNRGMLCTYDKCFVDDDCAAGAVCMCGTPGWLGSRCSSAGCRVDADCPGSYCSPTFGMCGNYAGVIGYACHTPEDECTDDADCAGKLQGMPYCNYNPAVAHWVCSNAGCVG